jgi:hypothetical protein
MRRGARNAEDELMAASYPTPLAGDMQTHNVLRDGELVAVLMAVDQGETFTVFTEIYGQGSAVGSVTRRPYIFENSETGLAFLAEALTSFTYLGCEVRDQ